MLPETSYQIFVSSLDRNIRDLKTSQVMASNGLLVSVVAIGISTKWLMRLVDSSRLGAVCYYGDSKKDKTFC